MNTAVRAGGALGRSAASAADRWAVRQLAASGEEALGRVYLPKYLLLALCILLPPLGATALMLLLHMGC